MAALVPAHPPLPVAAQATTGVAVRGPTFADLARANNWALGRGAQLIPGGSGTGLTLDNAGEYILKWRVRPRYQAVDRLWIVHARAVGALAPTSPLEITTPSSGTGENYAVIQHAYETTGIEHVEQRASRSSSEETLELQLKPDGSDIEIDSIQCVEIPRIELETSETGTAASDLGVDINDANVAQPMWADSAGSTDTGWNRLARACETRSLVSRRVGHFAWAVPCMTDGASVTSFALSMASTTTALMFLVDIPIVCRPGLSTAVAWDPDPLEWRPLVKVTAGTVGRMRMTMSTGDTVTATFSNTTWQFLSPTAINVTSEDYTEETGLYTGDFADSTATFRWWRVSGAGSLYCAGLSIFET